MALLSKKYFGVKNFEFLLRDRLNLLADQFDFILIDTPPSIEFFTINALTVARMVIIPCPCEFLSAHGVERIEKMIPMIQAKTNPRIEFRVLITMFDKLETASKLIYNKLQEMYRDKLFQTIIELDGKLKESQIVSMPAIAYDRTSLAGRQYFNLAKEILSLAPFQRTLMEAMERSYENKIQLGP
jgi:chromosome partitioning protein